MNEAFANYIPVIALYFPIGAIGVYRWSMFFVKKLVAKRYHPVSRNGYRDTMSLVVPVYNEDPAVFTQALESWLANAPDEIIAVIDHTDRACIEVFKRFQERHESLRLIVTERPGKRQALADGIRVAQSNIIALVDSDTIWDRDIAPALFAPFIDPLVGGVGPRQDVLRRDTPARRLFSIHLDHRYFDEMAYLATVGDALTCLSGRTAWYRREAIVDICDQLENETFWGARCVSGDDKCLTRLVQERGWKVRYQATARVRTPGAADLRTLFKQQVRWARNSYRSDLKSLFGKRAWIWKREPFLAYHVIDKFTQPFTLLLGPIYFVYSIIWGHYLVAGILFCWWFLSRSIKLHSYMRRHSVGITLLPMYVCATYFMAFLKVYALVTIRHQGWITRWDKSRLGKLQFLGSLPAYAGTALNKTHHSLVVGSSKHSVAAPGDQPVAGAAVNASEYEQSLLDGAEQDAFARYTVAAGDTVSGIARRLGTSAAALVAANNWLVAGADAIAPGQDILIPASALRQPLNLRTLVSKKKPIIAFDAGRNTVTVDGVGSVVTLATIREALGRSSPLERLERDEWVLRANLRIGEGVTLVIDGAEVTWLKLASDDNGYVWVKGEGGSIVIANTVITSWDEALRTVRVGYATGRSYLFVRGDGRMDITKSELAYLGWPGEAATDGRAATEGTYGVSWKAAPPPSQGSLVTGVVTGSSFHDNYFGVYAYGATGMVFEGNEAYKNVRYGFDFHDGTRAAILEHNISRNNGDHGIIFSEHNTRNIVRENTVYQNARHGIMLHDQSNGNIVEQNTVYENADGISMYGSDRNVVRGNEIRGNRTGVRANAAAAGNYIAGNTVTANGTAIYIYDGARGNFITDNTLRDNGVGIYLKDAPLNTVAGVSAR